MDMKDYVLEIYKVEAEKYNKTREIHWKMNIAIWTVLIVAIYGKSQHGLTISHNFWNEMVIYFCYLLVHFIFIFLIHGSLHRSLTRMHNMASFLLEQGDELKIKWKDFEKRAFKKYGLWEFWQLWITFFLIIIFHIINQT